MRHIFLAQIGHRGTKGYRIVIAEDKIDAEIKVQKVFKNEDIEILETIE